MITDPMIEQRPNGGHENGPCTVIRMYKKECKVSGGGDKWFLDAPFAYEGAWDVWAVTESQDAALVLAGEYLREHRDHDNHQ
jgi:hypothetical protein